jgi:hypothetical protein
MGTVANLLENIRYDIQDYEEGLAYDDRLLYIYINRMIGIMDSSLAAMRSDLVHGTETNIDTVESQNYVDLTNMNNGQWDSIRSIWIGSDRKYKIPIDLMFYKRKFYSGDAEPEFWALEDRWLLFETTADAAHTDFVIHYNKKHRPRLESWSDTFTANASTDFITLTTGQATFVTGDGPFTVSNSGGALPTGLAASTNYWVWFDPDNPTKLKIATSKANAINESFVDITGTGSGTHTITLGTGDDSHARTSQANGSGRTTRGYLWRRVSQASI